MGTKYNIKLARNLFTLQDDAFQRLTQTTKAIAQAPLQTRTDRFVRLAKVAALDGVRRYQFFRPERASLTVAASADAVYFAARAATGRSLLALGAPFLLTSIVLYALVGTGEKARFASPNASGPMMAAAMLTQVGFLGIPQILAYRSGRAFEKAGHISLARACYGAATCLGQAIEPLRAVVICASFVMQVPYAIIGTLVNLGMTAASAAYHQDLSPQTCLTGADDLFHTPRQQPRKDARTVKPILRGVGQKLDEPLHRAVV